MKWMSEGGPGGEQWLLSRKGPRSEGIRRKDIRDTHRKAT